MKKIIASIFGLYITVVNGLDNQINQVEHPPDKSMLCVACHGQTGISGNPLWPNLAAQHQSYLLKQLQNFKQGQSRYNPLMSAVVASLSNDDMLALATFYSTQKSGINDTPLAVNLNLGEQLYRLGDAKKQITACIACHGPTGQGNAETGFPVLSAQHALYTIEQLNAFKHKKRTNDLNQIMHDISQHMSDEDINAVAHYLQQLH